MIITLSEQHTLVFMSRNKINTLPQKRLFFKCKNQFNSQISNMQMKMATNMLDCFNVTIMAADVYGPCDVYVF